jgi:hypothetical protein
MFIQRLVVSAALAAAISACGVDENFSLDQAGLITNPLTIARGGMIELRTAQFDKINHTSYWGEFVTNVQPADAEPYYINEMEMAPLDSCIEWAGLPDDATSWDDIDVGSAVTLASSENTFLLERNDPGPWYGGHSVDSDVVQSADEEIFDVSLAGSTTVPAQTFTAGLRMPARPQVTTFTDRDDYIFHAGESFTLEWIPGGYDRPATVAGEVNFLILSIGTSSSSRLCKVIDDGSFTFGADIIDALPRKGTVAISADVSRFVDVDGRPVRMVAENQFMNNYSRYKK